MVASQVSVNSMDMSLSKLQETVKAREVWCASVRRVRCWAWEMLAKCRGGHGGSHWGVPLVNLDWLPCLSPVTVNLE